MDQGIPTIENNVVHHNGDDDLTGTEIGTKETRNRSNKSTCNSRNQNGHRNHQ